MKTYLIGQMPRLIQVFAEPIFGFVFFSVLQRRKCRSTCECSVCRSTLSGRTGVKTDEGIRGHYQEIKCLILGLSGENLSLGFLTRSDTNQAVQPQ